MASSDNQRKLIFSILSFLNEEMNSDKFDSDSKESLEVACQCLENVYSVSSTNPEDRKNLFVSTPLPSIFDAHLLKSEKPASPEDKANAEKLKNEGNDLMKVECFSDAIEKYTSAIDLDPSNAVYLSNRAAAHSKMGNHELAIEDCQRALYIDPKYSKVMGRMGLAYTEMKEYEKAIESYTRALEFEPHNESYQNNLRVAQDMEAKAAAASASSNTSSQQMPTGPTLGGIDLNAMLGGAAAGGGMGGLGGVLNNPDFMNMATKLMQNPQVMNAFSSAMQQNGSSQQPAENPANMNAFLQMGQRLAEQIEREDPEQVARLREQFGGVSRPPNNQDGSGTGEGGGDEN